MAVRCITKFITLLICFWTVKLVSDEELHIEWQIIFNCLSQWSKWRHQTESLKADILTVPNEFERFQCHSSSLISLVRSKATKHRTLIFPSWCQLNPFSLAETAAFVILLCVIPDDFTHQGWAFRKERVKVKWINTCCLLLFSNSLKISLINSVLK